MWVNRVSPASLCSGDSFLLGREGSQCSSHQNVDLANSMDLFSQSASSQSQQVKDNREGKDQSIALEKQGQKCYMKFLTQLSKKDGRVCTAEQKAWSVAHTKQSFDLWDISQQEKTESKQLLDVLCKLKEDLRSQFTEMANTIKTEINNGFASQKKSSTEPLLDSQYSCLLTQLIQGQAEIRHDIQKVNENLEYLSSQLCKMEGVMSANLSQHKTTIAALPTSEMWSALTTKLDLVSSKMEMLIPAEHCRNIVSNESRTDESVPDDHLRGSECHYETPVCAKHCTSETMSRDQSVPQPSTEYIVENEESIYSDKMNCKLPSHEKNPFHVMAITAQGLRTPSKHTQPRNREVDQPNAPSVYESDTYGSTLKKRCTQPLSWNKTTRRGGGAISTPVTRRRSKRNHKRTDESSPVMFTDSPFSALNSHKPVLPLDSAHMPVSSQFVLVDRNVSHC